MEVVQIYDFKVQKPVDQKSGNCFAILDVLGAGTIWLVSGGDDNGGKT